MADRLFVSEVQCTGGRMLLGFAVGRAVAVEGGGKRRELAGGLAECALTLSSGEDRFDVRAIVDADGVVTKVIASAQEIADDWYEEPAQRAEETGRGDDIQR